MLGYIRIIKFQVILLLLVSKTFTQESISFWHQAGSHTDRIHGICQSQGAAVIMGEKNQMDVVNLNELGNIYALCNRSDGNADTLDIYSQNMERQSSIDDCEIEDQILSVDSLINRWYYECYTESESNEKKEDTPIKKSTKNHSDFKRAGWSTHVGVAFPDSFGFSFIQEYSNQRSFIQLHLGTTHVGVALGAAHSRKSKIGDLYRSFGFGIYGGYKTKSILLGLTGHLEIPIGEHLGVRYQGHFGVKTSPSSSGLFFDFHNYLQHHLLLSYSW